MTTGVGITLAGLRVADLSDARRRALRARGDQTPIIARRLAHTHPEVEVVHLAEKGRGRA